MAVKLTAHTLRNVRDHVVQMPDTSIWVMLHVQDSESAFRVSVTHRQYPSRGRRRQEEEWTLGWRASAGRMTDEHAGDPSP
jgi:hypothetical protein